MASIVSTDVRQARSATLGQQFERIGWALFLIMIGGIALLPSGSVPDGTWLVGTGLIMIGLNVARHRNGISTSSFTIVLGLIALALGVSEVVGAALPVFPLLLVAIGAHIVYSVCRRQ